MKGIESSFPAFHALRLRSALQHQLFGEEESVQRMGTFLREVIEREVKRLRLRSVRLSDHCREVIS